MNLEELERNILRGVMGKVKPPEPMTVSEWADNYRYLSLKSSAVSGKWYTDRAPYQRGMMDVVLDPAYERIVLMTSAQIGKTELINNSIGYFIDREPCPILAVMPTVEKSEEWSKERFSPMVDETPTLRDKISDPKSRDSSNTINRKMFPGGYIAIVGANAPAGLASRPVRIVVADEVDRFPRSAGGEGDPVALAVKRTSTFWNRKIILTSTPTDKGRSRIETEWNQSDQRRFYVPCPDCGEYQHLQWGNLQFNTPGETVYACEHCGVLIEDRHKPAMLAAGEWRQEQPGRPCAGFHLNALYSPWVTWRQLAEEYLASKDDPELLKVFVNTALGETYEEEKSQRRETEIIRLIDENKPRGVVPDDTSAVIITADTQRSGVYYQVLAFGYGDRLTSHLVDHGFTDSFEDLDTLSHAEYESPDGKTFRPLAGIIDSGGGTNPHRPKHSRTTEVYEFCRTHPFWRPVKGRRDQSTPYNVTRLDYYPSRDGKKRPIPGGLNLYVINVTLYKNTLAAKLMKEPGTPGSISLHGGMNDGGPLSGVKYALQLCAEYQDDRGYWECPKNKDNHFWDCWVYALALADMAGLARRKRPDTEVRCTETPPQRSLFRQIGVIH